MRATLNILSVLLLTFLLARLVTWSNTAAAAINAFSQTALWVWFRSSLSVHGPEDEETLMMASITAAALVLSIGVVWAVNRATRSSAVFRASRTSRVVG